jgi:putative nucleotidyltransferase with HDIG domain
VLAAESALEAEPQRLREFVSELDRSCLYAQDHSINVADHVEAIHRELGTPSGEIRRRYLAALLHDIGKTAIPLEVLGKPSALTPDEFELIKSHPAMGADVVAAIEELRDLRAEILHHHERIDGTGYPAGLAGDDIPFAARVLAVADTYDAMTSDRVYRSARGRIDAIEELVRCSGSQLDGEIVQAFLATLDTSAPSGVRG